MLEFLNVLFLAAEMALVGYLVVAWRKGWFRLPDSDPWKTWIKLPLWLIGAAALMVVAMAIFVLLSVRWDIDIGGFLSRFFLFLLMLLIVLSAVAGVAWAAVMAAAWRKGYFRLPVQEAKQLRIGLILGLIGTITWTGLIGVIARTKLIGVIAWMGPTGVTVWAEAVLPGPIGVSVLAGMLATVPAFLLGYQALWPVPWKLLGIAALLFFLALIDVQKVFAYLVFGAFHVANLVLGTAVLLAIFILPRLAFWSSVVHLGTSGMRREQQKAIEELRAEIQKLRDERAP